MSAIHELRPDEVGTPVGMPYSLVPPDAKTYDYIIVGGGTAGCVLASRLSEDKDVSVLLIEQGPVADTWQSRVPLLSGNVYHEDGLAARWWSLPMQEADNRFVEIMRGEALGGTSRINGLLYTRGSPGDYNQWKNLGNPGWGYSDLEPYFVKSENTQGHPASSFRGKTGLWHNKKFTTTPFEISSHVKRAVIKAGIEEVADVNDPDTPAMCVGALDAIIDSRSQRVSTYLAFLPPNLAKGREDHLKICTRAIVSRVALHTDGATVRATGVYFEAKSPREAYQRFYAKARREVVICAGALGSPQILMLSGLGPKGHLEEKHVPVIRDMPAVGAYLQDHIGIPISFEVPLEESLHELEVHPFKAILEFVKYLVAGRGLLSRPFQTGSTFIPSRLLDGDGVLSASKDTGALDASIPENRPDIEFMHIANTCSDADHVPRRGVYTLLLTLVRPKSQGTVRLATCNPRARPDVELGFLTDAEDYIPLRKGVRFALRIGDEVRKQGYKFDELLVPEGKSDEDVDRFIRANIRTCFHYTSTCRMGVGVAGTRPSVVDPILRVHGVEGLRVCDTSVFPEIVGSHTMAPAVVVAEKCADLMKHTSGPAV